MVFVPIPDHTEWVWFCSYNIAALLMLILCIIHTRKFYQDLFTEERACFAHRKGKPKLTPEYKFVQWLTLAVLYLHFCDSFLFGLEMFFTWSHQTCREINNAGGWFLVLGKGCMYMLFMYRLIICYGDSAIGYRNCKKILVIIGWLNIVYAIVAEGITTYLTIRYWLFVQDTDAFPNPCFPLTTDWRVTIFGTMMQVWDGIMNPLSLILFVLPLRKLRALDNVMAAMDSAVNRNVQRSRRKLRYVAIKYTVLTFVAFITTLGFWTFPYLLPNEYFLVAFDVVINSACVALMTAYYNDKLYYERLCCCFVICCRSAALLSDEDRRAAYTVDSKTDLTADATAVSALDSNSSMAVEIETRTEKSGAGQSPDPETVEPSQPTETV